MVSSVEKVLKEKQNEEEKHRAILIFEPFFFFSESNFQKLPAYLKKNIKEPVYLVTVFCDIESVKKWLGLLPIFKIVTRFIVKNKDILFSFLEQNYDGTLDELMEVTEKVKVNVI